MQNRNTRSPVPALMFAVSVVGSTAWRSAPFFPTWPGRSRPPAHHQHGHFRLWRRHRRQRLLPGRAHRPHRHPPHAAGRHAGADRRAAAVRRRAALAGADAGPGRGRNGRRRHPARRLRLGLSDRAARPGGAHAGPRHRRLVGIAGGRRAAVGADFRRHRLARHLWRASAVRRRRPAGPAPPARTPRRPSRAAAPVAPVGAAVVPRRAGAAAGLPGILVRLLRRLRLPGRPRAAPAGAVGRTGRFHRLRLRRRLHAVGPAGRAADRTPGPAPLYRWRWAPPLWSTWRCCPPRGRCRPCCSSPPSGARPRSCA